MHMYAISFDVCKAVVIAAMYRRPAESNVDDPVSLNVTSHAFDIR